MPASPKKRSPKTFFVVIFLFFALAVGLMSYAILQWNARAKARNMKNPVSVSPETLAAGKDVYEKHCQSCHGAAGDGKGEKAPELSVAPGDFTDAAKMSGLTDGELFMEITEGHHPMPAFADKLVPEQRWDAVDYIRTFAAKPAATQP